MSVKILIVDDEPEIADLMSHLLTKYIDDFEVLSALDGDFALDLVENMMKSGISPDLTLMDLKMPKMDGITCTRRMTELGVHNIYILSAYLKPEIAEEAVNAGARGIMHKSDGYSTIAEKVAKKLRVM